MTAPMRTFESGATRNLDTSKLDYEGFLSPLVVKRFAEYMHGNRIQADGSMRDGDNWQKGIPKTAYMKSGYRHFMDWWLEHRGHETEEGVEFAICGLMFNAMGFLHEHLAAKAARLPEPHHAIEAPMPPVLEIPDDEDLGLNHGVVSA